MDDELSGIPDRENIAREQLKLLRDKHAQQFGRVQSLFKYVCAQLTGQSSAQITLDGNGLSAFVKIGGSAMETLKVIAFDITAMLLSVEGRAGFPAFLIHDSPREGDLGESIYHRPFSFFRDLETKTSEPLFQYIVTTTSAPPDSLARVPYTVLELNGLEAANRLLKVEL